jgi:hypothetical protein
VTSALSSAVSLLAATADLIPHGVRVVLALYVVLCFVVLLGLYVLRDLRKFLNGE